MQPVTRFHATNPPASSSGRSWSFNWPRCWVGCRPIWQQLSKREWAALVGEIEAFPPLERRRVFHVAFERRYRVQTLDAIAFQSRQSAGRVANPRFQVICCLDEREESFRRHLEEIAPDVETFGVGRFLRRGDVLPRRGDAHFVPLCPIVIQPQHWVERRRRLYAQGEA